MAGQWYCRVDGTTYGPLTSQQLVKAVRGGKVSPSDLVSKDLGGKWVRADAVKGLFAPPDSDPPHAAQKDHLHPAPSEARQQSNQPISARIVAVPATDSPLAETFEGVRTNTADEYPLIAEVIDRPRSEGAAVTQEVENETVSGPCFLCNTLRDDHRTACVFTMQPIDWKANAKTTGSVLFGVVGNMIAGALVRGPAPQPEQVRIPLCAKCRQSWIRTRKAMYRYEAVGVVVCTILFLVLSLGPIVNPPRGVHHGIGDILFLLFVMIIFGAVLGLGGGYCIYHMVYSRKKQAMKRLYEYPRIRELRKRGWQAIPQEDEVFAKTKS